MGTSVSPWGEAVEGDGGIAELLQRADRLPPPE